MPRKSREQIEVENLRLVQFEPRPEPEAPKIEAPEGLSGYAKEVFELVAAEDCYDFTVTGLHLLEMYAQQCALSHEAAQHCHAEGMVLPNGKVNPWLRIQYKASSAAITLADKLEITPQARARAANRRQPRDPYAIRGFKPWTG